MHDQFEEAHLYAEDVMEFCRQGGTSLSRCARSLHLDYVYVIGVIHRFGLDHTFGEGPEKNLPKRLADRIVQMYDEGMDRREIYLETRLHLKSIASILRANNRDYRITAAKRQRRKKDDVPVHTNVLKAAIRDAMEYWEHRSPEFYRYWQEELNRVKK